LEFRQELSYGVRAFVRRDRSERVHLKFSDAADVRVEAIEEITFSWKWLWDEWVKA